jgi:hypothetical protein
MATSADDQPALGSSNLNARERAARFCERQRPMTAPSSTLSAAITDFAATTRFTRRVLGVRSIFLQRRV